MEKICEINAHGECDDEIICGCEGCRFYKDLQPKEEVQDKVDGCKLKEFNEFDHIPEHILEKWFNEVYNKK